MAASRRTVTINDMKRNSAARKRTHRQTIKTQQQQADVLARLWKQAKAEAKASG